MKESLVYNYFTDDEFLRISNKIKEAEKITSGELRVSIKEERPRFNKKSVRELAEEEFYKLGMDKTRDKTGIIIYMLLNEHQFYILADSGINEKVEESTWDKVRDEMQLNFKNGEFGKGVVLGVEKVGNILAEHFPIKSDDTNELSNKVVL
ncbi:MAG: TPM domain-containing protein [Ignavibacteriae bacterium]|nr:TPM domain-containing protein [Ignavibacteriota bacterium]NOH00094.1 TPM domain-containing protein [Ignavibacteriota bacterium]